ncbi:protein tiptop [Chrysoperla carnea]|uniref:protein tiptop n=1 Tax=Chrysoperla carnea TaxID=189513 RepID=UPI001D063F5D|nr:protein tiptop [Chrysoperla carnea]
MPRRKQDCPKRMKWEGGEGGEEDGSPDTDKLEGDDTSIEGSTPRASPGLQDDELQQQQDQDETQQHTSDVPEEITVVPVIPISSSPQPNRSSTPLSLINSESHRNTSNVDEDVMETGSIHNNNNSERDVMSPRCQSRESTESASVAPPRCPSNEPTIFVADRSASILRGIAALPASALSPVGVALPATLPPAAAAALLPPNSAAMAAYLAAQHSHRLMMTSPLPTTFPRGAVSPLITSSTSPPGGLALLANTPSQLTSPTPIPMQSPLNNNEGAILDFSTKRPQRVKSTESEEGDDAMNLSKTETPSPSEAGAPLDLSVSNRKRTSDDNSSQLPRKSTRSSDYKPTVVSPWTSPVASHLPYFAAAVAAASLSPKNSSNISNMAESQLWNGKLKHSVPTPSDATKALEKMSELSKLGGEDLFRSMANSSTTSTSNTSTGNRHSAWQSHWLNKGAEQAKDVLKCVWCKQSFPSLAAMTTHMKEAKHCGVNVPVPPMSAPSIPAPQMPPQSSPSVTASSPTTPSSTSSSSKPSQADLNLLIKETMPLPRKLVRGQDVWLGKGAEQTRQILKCMWCGQSFRSLAEMTSHMQQTQHYTNIISQEQIISWKSSDDSKGGGGGSGGGPTSGGPGGASSHVSAVLTCKVCDQAFSSLKELSNHMVKNSHYKEHIMRSITESGGRRRQTREKRKKSLPVRKLLELERAQHEFKNGDAGNGGIKPSREQSLAGRISCEKCGDKIETSLFVDHIRQCVGGGTLGVNQRNFLKNALMSNSILPPDNSNMIVGHVTPTNREDRKSVSDESPSPVLPPRHHRSPSSATDLSTKELPTTQSEGTGSSPSVLNAIEKLIEKSFDSRVRQNTANFSGNATAQPTAPMGSSILKRLGIDESVDYTKPLVDPQTMNILRNYHNHQHGGQHQFSRRERSGSESSSMSERGSSRIDSMTPERKMEPPSITPRTTPDKRVQTPVSEKSTQDEVGENLTIKKEVIDEDEQRQNNVENHRQNITIKKERMDDETEEDDRASYHSGNGILPPRISTDSRMEDMPEEDGSGVVKRSNSSAGMPSPSISPRQPTPSAVDQTVLPPNSPCRNSASSPASSDRSGTPRSIIGTPSEKKAGGSLGALSSMFDNLSGGGSSSNNNENNSSSGRRTSSHPLAALQKLCDKTETHHTNQRSGQTPNSNSGSTSSSTPSTSQALPQTQNTGTTPGAILAFSWACNDAVMTSDSIMKCAFCDTPFISKGAYRHHLSKMHFVKDGVIPDPVSLKAHQATSNTHGASGSNNSGKSTPGGVNSSGNTLSNSGSNTPSVSTSAKSPQPPASFEESPHSKFLKYTELAKQLSSKYV